MAIPLTHDHVGISVCPEDLAPTIDWYSGVLGFTEERRFDAHGTTFVFLLAGSVRIELVAGATSRQAPTRDITTSMDPSRLHHVCFSVPDLDTCLDELARHGVELVGGPMDVPAIGQRLAFVVDNLGNVIELTQAATR